MASTPSRPGASPCPPTPPLLPTAATPPPKDLGSAAGDDRRWKPPEARCSSPDPSCAICLGELENMSYTDSCFHKFCFTCLLEWSKVRPVCPLCKAKFSSIIHTIKSDDNYESYELPPPPPPSAPVDLDLLQNIQDRHRELDAYLQNLRRFRYNSPEAAERLYRQRRQELEATMGHQLPTLPASRRPSRRPGTATSDFRRQVYEENMYVEPASVADITGRYRECSPQWYRNNQAQTHRLVPWLNRELNAVMRVLDEGNPHNPQQTSYLIQVILDLIQRHEIRSQELHDLLLPYFRNRTEHFQHELFNFARSVYDMAGFDRHANYAAREQPLQPLQRPDTGNSTTFIVSSGEDSSSDIEVVGEVRVSPRETLTDRVRRRLIARLPRPHRPFPGPSAEAATSATLPAVADQPLMEGPSTSSGEASSNFSRLVIPEDTSDEDATVEVVDVIPPRPNRNFDVIHILTSDEEETPNEVSVQIDLSTEEEEYVSPVANRPLPLRLRKRCRIEWRKTIESKRRRRFGTSSSSSSERSPSVTPRRRRYSSVASKKGKGKGKGKKSGIPLPQTSDTVHQSRCKDSSKGQKKMIEAKESSEEEEEDVEVDDNRVETRHRGGAREARESSEEEEVEVEDRKMETTNHRVVKMPLSSSSSDASFEKPSLTSDTDDDDDDDKPLAQKFSRSKGIKTKKAVMDQSPLEEYKVKQIGERDLRLKILNRKYIAQDLSSRLHNRSETSNPVL